MFNLTKEHLRPALVTEVTFVRLGTYCAKMRQAGARSKVIWRT